MAATSFRSQIARNKRNSLFLVLIVLWILIALGASIGFVLTGDLTGIVGMTVVALVLGILMTAGSWFSGDQLVLRASQARRVDEATAPQLTNVVREMSLAAGVPMPAVYVIEDTAPNAFATGRDPQHASIAITTGLLQKLDREELQGVIGHELSHVRNYDIRFTLLVGVLVGSIALIADMYLRIGFWTGFGGRGRRSSGSSDSGGLGLVVLVISIVLAILAPIAARLVQLAVSRQREYLADASAVELTRNPVGLENALVKIAADQEPLEVANRATQHMYVVNPMKKLSDRGMGLFSTHPPILDRVNRLRAMYGQPALDAQQVAALRGLE
ncbi:MAG: M48 family metallopeptidase [Chloroflexi bacterium]|nr:M48 family metallopeptidase [Chloroflexota bacterium]